MASITPHITDKLISLYIGMFDAAPGASNLASMQAQWEEGLTLKQIAATLGTTDAFRTIYPGYLLTSEFADKLVTSLLGDNVDAATRDWSVNWVKKQVDNGVSFTDVIVMATNALQVATNTAYDLVKSQQANKFEVAKYHTVTLDKSSDNLSELQSVIANVTADTASVATARTDVALALDGADQRDLISAFIGLTQRMPTADELGTLQELWAQDKSPSGLLDHILGLATGVPEGQTDTALFSNFLEFLGAGEPGSSLHTFGMNQLASRVDKGMSAQVAIVVLLEMIRSSDDTSLADIRARHENHIDAALRYAEDIKRNPETANILESDTLLDQISSDPDSVDTVMDAFEESLVPVDDDGYSYSYHSLLNDADVPAIGIVGLPETDLGNAGLY